MASLPLPTPTTTAISPSSSVVLALTTESSTEKATALAQELLRRGLAACVALNPLRSVYHWQGRLEESVEVQLLIKSHPDVLVALEKAVHELHSYSTPEWLVWCAEASPAYGTWLQASCGVNPDGYVPVQPDWPGDADPTG
jgi:periplasmic divalent cation tolerance protein